MVLSSPTNTALEKAFSALWQRQQTISHNIANEDTPGYKAKRLEFESLLKNEISNINRGDFSRRESVSRIEGVKAREYELENLTGRADGNNVVLDNEYIELARTQIQYNAIQQRINGYYTNLKYVISGGR
ncbi:MAG: flagellar basal body rod protein FlgB [Oscillospiraceae bacterium]|jgi:flagellar basal-body rod protein FlgB|nr:flagellar basal body rod protein FlgB [Oscillospiraceae bacterium]